MYSKSNGPTLWTRFDFMLRKNRFDSVTEWVSCNPSHSFSDPSKKLFPKMNPDSNCADESRTDGENFFKLSFRMILQKFPATYLSSPKRLSDWFHCTLFEDVHYTCRWRSFRSIFLVDRTIWTNQLNTCL